MNWRPEETTLLVTFVIGVLVIALLGATLLALIERRRDR